MCDIRTCPDLCHGDKGGRYPIEIPENIPEKKSPEKKSVHVI